MNDILGMIQVTFTLFLFVQRKSVKVNSKVSEPCHILVVGLSFEGDIVGTVPHSVGCASAHG